MLMIDVQYSLLMHTLLTLLKRCETFAVFIISSSSEFLVEPHQSCSLLTVRFLELPIIFLYQSSAERFVEIVQNEENQWKATTACVQALNQVSSAQVLRGWKIAFPSMREQQEI